MARILSIEDDADTQHIIGQALFRAGYEIHYAWNGQEGYEKILALNPDMILLDLFLPLMNGVELLTKLQANKGIRKIPIIIVSGFGDDKNLLGHSVVALGASAYLRKPVVISELISCVKHTLANSESASAASKPNDAQELRKGAIRADPKFYTVWINDRLITTLPHKRFVLFRILLENIGPITSEQLLQKLGYGPRQVNALKQTIHRLRQDLGKTENRRIKTTPLGYELIG